VHYLVIGGTVLTNIGQAEMADGRKTRVPPSLDFHTFEVVAF
jgi:hypothetical protein